MPAANNPSGYKHVSSYLDRHFQMRWRYRKGDFTMNLGTVYESDDFFYRLENAQKGIRVTNVPMNQTRGTIAFALGKWLKDDRHRRCTELTKRHRADRVARLNSGLGELKVKHIRVDDIQRYMDANSHRPALANKELGILRAMLDGEVKAGRIPANPALSVDRISFQSGEFYTWTEEDIDVFFEFHPIGTNARLAMALMLYTGAYRKEAVQFGWHNVSGDRFKFARHGNASHKHLTLIDIPIHPGLRAVLDTIPEDADTFLQTQYGKQRSAPGLGNKMREWADLAGLPDCTAHGLRKACARRLADAGAHEQEVAAVLGYADATTPHEIVGMGHRPELANEGFAAVPGGVAEAEPAGSLPIGLSEAV